LEELGKLFEIPLTTFGYGDLNEIPAPYALRYADPHSFISLLLSAAPFGWLLPGFLLLRSFRFGFQRFWERVAWDLNVRLNVSIQSITRSGEGIDVVYSHPVQQLNEQITHVADQAHFDYLIVACPPISENLQQFLTLSDEEASLLERVRYIPYAVASFEVAGVTLPQRVAFHLPLPQRGSPMVIYQAHADNELMSFYARLRHTPPTSEDELLLRAHIERYVAALGGRLAAEDDWHSYDAWLYFKHVSAEDMRAGYFERWEQLQGAQRTYYTGGLFDFDFVEGIVQYSRRLVETHFLGK
jgi:hypothetical protein